jgi:hypothetical protein
LYPAIAGAVGGFTELLGCGFIFSIAVDEYLKVSVI